MSVKVMLQKTIKCGNYSLEFGKRTMLMGIINVTPDSFSDGGRFFDSKVAISHAKRLAKEGADIIDIGGESTRPGSEPVTSEEEQMRVIPVIEGIADEVEVPISIDTCKSEVAKAALDAGACMINDISATRFDPKIVDVAAQNNVPIILMHMKGTPKDMQRDPTYGSLIDDIKEFLRERIDFVQSKGVKRASIIVDPGIGFGKTTEHNYEIIRRLGDFKELELPILIGTSRKSFIGNTLGLDVNERLEGTLATITMCIMNGADIIRVHDVKEVQRAARMTDAIYR
ncbi:MAG: dihydropteroate synthase [Methanomassiliicoccales archaeon]|nr:MAG: dihydropteroate synthase [Methanomassiliicoccales archaeon]